MLQESLETFIQVQYCCSIQVPNYFSKSFTKVSVRSRLEIKKNNLCFTTDSLKSTGIDKSMPTCCPFESRGDQFWASRGGELPANDSQRIIGKPWFNQVEPDSEGLWKTIKAWSCSSWEAPKKNEAVGFTWYRCCLRRSSLVFILRTPSVVLQWLSISRGHQCDILQSRDATAALSFQRHCYLPRYRIWSS